MGGTRGRDGERGVKEGETEGEIIRERQRVIEMERESEGGRDRVRKRKKGRDTEGDRKRGRQIGRVAVKIIVVS